MTKNGSKSDRIIDAAVKVIADHGYHGAKVTAIAKEAGVADGTIYLYFKNKEHLLIELFQTKMGLFIDYSKQQIERETTAGDKLYQLIRVAFEAIVGRLRPRCRDANRAPAVELGAPSKD